MTTNKSIFSKRKFWSTRLLLSFLLMTYVEILHAYDFAVDGIYYNRTSATTAEVTNPPKDKSYRGSVHIPEEVVYNGVAHNVTSIEAHAFKAFEGLTEVIIGNNVTSIGECAFMGCTRLANLTIGNSVTSIGNDAFENCYSLTGLIIPTTVTFIGESAFYGCRELTELTIPNNVTFIGNAAFSRCIGLEKIVVEEGNPCYDSRQECNAIIRKDDSEPTLIAGCKNTIIPDGVAHIGEYAFYSQSNLEELTIPNSVISIDDWAFYGCTKLKSLTLPNSVTSIGGGAFSDCPFLASIISLNMVPPTIAWATFDEITENSATLHVPMGCKESYLQADYWKNFLNIQDDAATSIESVSTDKQGRIIICTLDGKRLNTTNVADLPKGIYIVNGKKIVVK